jgi:hypothetical protein
VYRFRWSRLHLIITRWWSKHRNRQNIRSRAQTGSVVCACNRMSAAHRNVLSVLPRGPLKRCSREMGEWGGALIPGAPPAAVLAQLSGTVISTMTQACRAAFSAASVRLVEPVYDCQVIATAETIGVSCEVNIEICTNMRLEHCCLTPHCCLSYRYSPDVDRRSLLRI